MAIGASDDADTLTMKEFYFREVFDAVVTDVIHSCVHLLFLLRAFLSAAVSRKRSSMQRSLLVH